MSELYEIISRRYAYATILSVKGSREGIEVWGAEKVVPPVVLYFPDSTYEVWGAHEILSSLEMHPYKAGTPDFNPERLADLEVSSFYNQLSHFPTLPSISIGETSCPHPVAEYIYGHMLYLKPALATEQFLAEIPFERRSKAHAELIERVSNNLYADTGVRLDLFSLPKKGVGTYCYIAEDGLYSPVAETFAFGFHRAVPCDRITREVSSLKSCEMFSDPRNPPYPIDKKLKPFVTMLRVAVVGTKHKMLDGGDLYPSGTKKTAAVLYKRTVTKDIESIPEEKQNLRYVSSRSGVEVVHIDESPIDELSETPGAIRLIFPGGVKIGVAPKEIQGYSEGEPIDLLIDFNTLSGKGAVAWFAMSDPENYKKQLSLEDCIEIFKKTPLKKIEVGSKTYDGYVIDIPVMRPGQRYTELSKTSNQITVDIISKAILRKEIRVKEKVEKTYQDLTAFRKAALAEIALIRKKSSCKEPVYQGIDTE